MRNLMGNYWNLLVVALLSCAPMAFGDQVTMTLQPIPGGQPNLGGAYTGAYPFSIDGSTTFTTAVCDDFNDQVYVGESWKVNVYSFSSLNASTPTVLFGVNGSAGQLQDYDEAAWLVEQMYKPANAASTSNISYAIWGVFEPSALRNDSSAQAWINSAASQTYSTGEFSNFEILTPISGTQPFGDGRPQEFLVKTPESSAPILFGADLMGLATLIFLFRRRIFRTQS